MFDFLENNYISDVSKRRYLKKNPKTCFLEFLESNK